MTNIDEIIDRLNGQIIIDDYKSPIIASIRTAETKHILTEFKQAVIAEHIQRVAIEYGYTKEHGVWIDPDGAVCLPKYLPYFLKDYSNDKKVENR